MRIKITLPAALLLLAQVLSAQGAGNEPPGAAEAPPAQLTISEGRVRSEAETILRLAASDGASELEAMFESAGMAIPPEFSPQVLERRFPPSPGGGSKEIAYAPEELRRFGALLYKALKTALLRKLEAEGRLLAHEEIEVSPSRVARIRAREAAPQAGFGVPTLRDLLEEFRLYGRTLWENALGGGRKWPRRAADPD